jgi:hypothetical protein
VAPGGQDDSSRDDVYRFQSLLFGSFVAVVFSFVPIALILILFLVQLLRAILAPSGDAD